MFNIQYIYDIYKMYKCTELKIHKVDSVGILVITHVVQYKSDTVTPAIIAVIVKQPSTVLLLYPGIC